MGSTLLQNTANRQDCYRYHSGIKAISCASLPTRYNAAMNAITDNLADVLTRIAEYAERHGRQAADVRLLAVSKTKPVADIRAAYAAGQTLFGENYLQEAIGKIQALADLPLSWHFIGGIQSNKTRAIAAHFDWVHTLASEKHARRLDRQRPEGLAPLKVCIQVNTSGESSKGGIEPDELGPLLRAVDGLKRLEVRGLMTIPAPSQRFEEQRRPFRLLHTLLDRHRADYPALDTLSMGMSGDLEAAIAEGATIVRIGTAIFGPRNPSTPTTEERHP